MPCQDTIAAISTPSGNGAVGIVRLSGPRSLIILEKVWKGKTPVSLFAPRHVYTGYINELESGETVDQVVVLYWKAPSSYTGEDLVEVQGHGGQVILETILKNLITAGARLAEAGEFTKRAFLNGRIDLAQAEAVADLIQTASARGAQLAERQLEGRLSEYVGRLRNDLKVMRAQMEAMIDFPQDEDVNVLRYEEISERVEVLSQKIRDLIETYQEGRSFREGVRIAIVGKPNVGKSSLFNALLREERAIVHSSPGTTRDLIEEVLEIRGLPIRFIDTAGLRHAGEEVESEGIERTKKRLNQADLILSVFDSNQPIDHEDEIVLELVKHRMTFYLYNKIDLPSLLPAEEIYNRVGEVPLFRISAKGGEGIGCLKEEIFSLFVGNRSRHGTTDIILTNLRHRTSLQKGFDSLAQVRKGCQEGSPLELLVSDLTTAMNSLGEVTGEVTTDEILSEIFSKFCIGK